MNTIPLTTTRFCMIVLLGCILSTSLFMSCGSSGDSKSADSTVASTPVEDTPFDTLRNFCNWTEIGLRATPSEKGKYVTTVYLGEGVTLRGDTASETSGGKRIHFHKVMLIDGKEGWIRDEFLAMDAVPGVFIGKSAVYLRPEESTVSDKTFAVLDLVAVKSPKGNWVEVNGKPAGKTWFQQGYAHVNELSFNKVDVDLAVLYRRAMETKDPAQQQSRLDLIRNNAAFQQSQLYTVIFPPEVVEYGEEGTPEYTSYDFSSSVLDFTNHNARFVPDADGVANSALYFDGKSYLTKQADDRTEISYCFWMKPDKVQVGSFAMILGNGCTSGYGVMFGDNQAGGMRLEILCGGVQVNITNSEYTVAPAQWTHICLVKTGTDFSLYVDGELSSSGSAQYNAPSGEFTVGAAPGCNPPGIAGYFTGTIDDLLVANYALDQAGVQSVKAGQLK